MEVVKLALLRLKDFIKYIDKDEEIELFIAPRIKRHTRVCIKKVGKIYSKLGNYYVAWATCQESMATPHKTMICVDVYECYKHALKARHDFNKAKKQEKGGE